MPIAECGLAGAGRDVTLHRLRRGRAVGPNLTLETPSEKSHISLDAVDTVWQDTRYYSVTT